MIAPKNLLLVLILIGLAFPAQSQKTKDILDRASRNSSRSDGGGGGGDGIFAVLQAADLLVDLFFLTGGAIANGQRRVLEKEDFMPRITSIEFSAQYSAVPTDYSIALARIRAHRGLFSTDLRFYHQFEEKFGDFSSYNSFDWQILMLNLITEEKVNLRVGTGIMTEQSTRSTFSESTIALDVYPTKRLRINAEGRFAIDYGTSTTVRREWNGGIYYRLAQHKKKGFHVFGNAMHARFYEAVDIWALSGGISMTIE